MVEREAFLLELSERIVPLVWEVPWSEVSSAKRIFISVWQLEAEVNNGGFHQYFWNSSGNLAADTPAALEAIGAIRTAEIVERANGLFGAGPPVDERLRLAALESIDENVFESLDEEFLAYPDDLSALLYDFVVENEDAFRAS
jgi:hypothetical protein